MYTQSYPARRTYEKYDALHYLLYLNEEEAEYTPFYGGLPGDGEAQPAAVPGYRYTGNMPDGGTLIAATKAEYGAFVSGLIRLTYSTDDEQALQTNELAALANSKHENAAKWKQEFADYQAYRATCKAQASAVLPNQNQ